MMHLPKGTKILAVAKPVDTKVLAVANPTVATFVAVDKLTGTTIVATTFMKCAVINSKSHVYLQVFSEFQKLSG
jgi:hypothetical protein